MSVAGFVLTGGCSTRMGRDKALLPWGASTLVERVAGLAREAAGHVSLVGAPERYAHLGLPCLPERYPGCGPLSGIEAALREGADWNLILACDMPNLDAGWLRRLLATAERSEHACVAAVHGGQLEPLCAAYHARLHGAVAEALAAGRYSVRNLLNTIDFSECAIDDIEAVANLNTPRDWARWSPR